MPSCFVTIATPDYYARALVLHESVREAMGSHVRFVVLAVCEEAATSASVDDTLIWLTPQDLALPFFWDMAFRYDLFGLANALKPFLLAYVLRNLQSRDVVFLDADTAVLGPFAEVDAAFVEPATSILLTPHWDRPQDRRRPPTAADLLRHGMYNGGFVALKAGAAAEAFITWWCERMRTDCRYEPENDLYGDQRWLDLVPALFDGVKVLRHRGYNAAYWNDPDRRPERRGDAWFIGDAPLRFYHFSRWGIETGESLARYREIFYRALNPDRDALLEQYRRQVLSARADVTASTDGPQVPFSTFTDGSFIPLIVRRAYGNAFASRSGGRTDLFTHGLELVLEPSETLPAFPGITMPHLYETIWRERPDLRMNRFDLTNRDGQLWFMEWAREFMQGDYHVPDRALEPAHQALAAAASSSSGTAAS